MLPPTNGAGLAAVAVGLLGALVRPWPSAPVSTIVHHECECFCNCTVTASCETVSPGAGFSGFYVVVIFFTWTLLVAVVGIAIGQCSCRRRAREAPSSPLGGKGKGVRGAVLRFE